MGNTPCGLFAFTGSVPGNVRVRAEDKRVGLGGDGFRAEGRPAGVKAGIGYRGEGNFGDRRIGIPRLEGLDDPLFSEIAHLTIAVEHGVVEVGVELGEDLGDEDRFVRVVAVTVIRDRKGGGIAPNIHGPDGDRVERIASEEDGNGALRMVRHIEQTLPFGVSAQPRGSVPTGIVATTLRCARLTTETVPLMPLVTYATWSLGWIATQRGSSPTPISASLMPTSLPCCVFAL